MVKQVWAQSDALQGYFAVLFNCSHVDDSVGGASWPLDSSYGRVRGQKDERDITCFDAFQPPVPALVGGLYRIINTSSGVRGPRIVWSTSGYTCVRLPPHSYSPPTSRINYHRRVQKCRRQQHCCRAWTLAAISRVLLLEHCKAQLY